MSLILAAILFLGAASQYVYEDRSSPQVEVTLSEAAQAADWFIARGAWTGDRAGIVWCAVMRKGDKFFAECHGDKTVAADSLPEGAVVKEVIN